MNGKKVYLITILAVAFVLGVVLSLSYKAPYYLMYREEPRKADCIIPLLGNEYLERKKEAYQLIAEGFSSVLLIPPRYRLVKVTDRQEKMDLQVKEELSELSIRAYKVNPQYRWYENTHIELIMAREYMLAYGFDSAIIVSSPYHMRRVKLLASNVFPRNEYDITCVPDRYESMYNPWWADRKGIMWISREYTKIAWFLFYHRFSELFTSFRSRIYPAVS